MASWSCGANSWPRPPNDDEVCTPEQSAELVRLMSNIRRDFRSVVVFDKPL
jgi:hypothetical protein